MQHTRRAGGVGPWLWIAVLIITGGFQLYRGAPIDGAVFLAAAVALIVIAPGVPGRRSSGRGTRSFTQRQLWWAAGAGFLLIAGVPIVRAVAAGIPFNATPVTAFTPALIAVIGIAALPVAWSPLRRARSGTRESRSATRRAAAAWAILALLVCLWELTSYFLAAPSAAADRAHPTISALLEPFIALPWGRIVGVALWLLGGVALLRIGRSNERDRPRGERGGESDA